MGEQELDEMCDRVHSSEAGSTPAFLPAPVAESTGDACHTGKVGLMRRLAPQCFEQCQASCPAVALAVDEYFKHGQDGAWKSACEHKTAWMCFVLPGHYSACEPLVKRAAMMGYHMARSEQELDEMCDRVHSS